MAKYRKRPIVVEAEQFWPDKTPWPEGVEVGSLHRYPLISFFIETLEGISTVSPGDWIITGVKGERYACNREVFDMTYEAVE